MNEKNEADDTLFWPLPDALVNSPEVAFRNQFAEKLKSQTVVDILKAYLYTSPQEMSDLVDVLDDLAMDEPLAGVGIELGSGCGLFSASLLKKYNIEKILALEIVEKMATTIMPKVVKELIGDDAKKIVSVVGSFDDIRLESNSLDFAVEIDSLHHSPNLNRTLTEIWRVLKPGGRLLCLDRSRPDWVSDAFIQKLLDKTYSKEFLKENGYPEDAVLTREQNGEHEYRLREWLAAFDETGFQTISVKEFRDKATFKMALKGLLSVMPLARKMYSGVDMPCGAANVWLKQKLSSKPVPYGAYGEFIYASMRKTVMLVRKP